MIMMINPSLLFLKKILELMLFILVIYLNKLILLFHIAMIIISIIAKFIKKSLLVLIWIVNNFQCSLMMFLIIKFKIFNQIFKKFSTTIIVINDDNKDKDNEKELFEELINIVHHFSTKISLILLKKISL